MRKKALLIITCLLAQGIAFGQYSESITSSRPGQAFTPNTTGKNIFQVQSGFTFNQVKSDIPDWKTKASSYTALFRYGILESVELRSTLGVSSSKVEGDFVVDTRDTGLSQFALGTKINILEGGGTAPALGLQADFSLPIVDNAFEAENVASTILLAHTQGLSESVGLSTNLGLIRDGNDSETVGLYVVNFGFALPGNFGTFIETYGFFTNDNFDVLFDTGLSYLVNDHLLFDMSAGYGNNDDIKSFFFDLGFSWRTGRN